MKTIIMVSLVSCLLISSLFAQEKKMQISVHINPVDTYTTAEFKLSANSTLATSIGFGYGSVSSINLNKYYDQSLQYGRNSDVVIPQIYFAPYLNIQYRHYFFKAKNRIGNYDTSNNSGVYIGARLKMYTAPVIAANEDVKSIKQNYMLGLLVGYQKALGVNKRFILNVNTGISTHANYNLSFFAEKPMLHSSIGYILK